MFVLEYLKVLGFGGQAGLNASLDEQWQVRYQFKCICRLSFMQLLIVEHCVGFTDLRFCFLLLIIHVLFTRWSLQHALQESPD
jgi:hypothetical protein